MYFYVFKGTSTYVALAKNEPFTCANPNPIYEPGDLWFEFGDTPEQALANLKESLTKDAPDLGESVASDSESKPAPKRVI